MKNEWGKWEKLVAERVTTVLLGFPKATQPSGLSPFQVSQLGAIRLNARGRRPTG